MELTLPECVNVGTNLKTLGTNLIEYNIMDKTLGIYALGDRKNSKDDTCKVLTANEWLTRRKTSHNHSMFMVRLEAVPGMYQKTPLAPLQATKLERTSSWNHQVGFAIQNCYINMYRAELCTMQAMKAGMKVH
jgi:hypothetical protein